MKTILILSIALFIPALGGTAIAETAKTKEAKDATDKSGTSIFIRLAEAGLSLSRSFTGPGSEAASAPSQTEKKGTPPGSKTPSASGSGDKEKKESEPAQFGFSSDVGQDSAINANFFLNWNGKDTPFLGGKVTPSLSMEGSISASDSTRSDAWRFRGMFTYYNGNIGPAETHWNRGVPGLPDVSYEIHPYGLWASLGFKYEADRDFTTSKFSGEFLLTFDAPRAGIGLYQDVPLLGRNSGGRGLIEYRWRPYFGVDFGHSSDNTHSNEKESTVLRLKPRIRGELALNFLSPSSSKGRDVTAFADYEFAFLPLEKGSQGHSFLSAGINIAITKTVGFAVTYTKGAQSPNFVDEERVTGSFTIGF